VADLLERGTSFAVQWLPSGTPDRAALAARLSPITYARADMPPLVTVHGSQDNTVPVAQAQALDTKLQQLGADAELHLVSGAGHGFTTPSGAWPTAEKAMFDFLAAHGI
jgi:dipeptidyl aminopeptidase/acylaminoacyl peptidase